MRTAREILREACTHPPGLGSWLRRTTCGRTRCASGPHLDLSDFVQHKIYTRICVGAGRTSLAVFAMMRA